MGLFYMEAPHPSLVAGSFSNGRNGNERRERQLVLVFTVQPSTRSSSESESLHTHEVLV